MIYLHIGIFEYGYPNFNAFLQFRLKLEHFKQHTAAPHSVKCDAINEGKQYFTGYTVTNF